MSYDEAKALAIFVGLVGILLCLIFWVAFDDRV